MPPKVPASLDATEVRSGDYITLVHRPGPPNKEAAITMQVEEVRPDQVIGKLAFHQPDGWDLPPISGEVIREATDAEIALFQRRRKAFDEKKITGCAACECSSCECLD